jgi:hypothetical protein
MRLAALPAPKKGPVATPTRGNTGRPCDRLANELQVNESLSGRPPPGQATRDKTSSTKNHRDPNQKLQHKIITKDKERVDNDRFSHKNGFTEYAGNALREN